jgi:hypothetical protein
LGGANQRAELDLGGALVGGVGGSRSSAVPGPGRFSSRSRPLGPSPAGPAAGCAGRTPQAEQPRSDSAPGAALRARRPLPHLPTPASSAPGSGDRPGHCPDCVPRGSEGEGERSYGDLCVHACVHACVGVHACVRTRRIVCVELSRCLLQGASVCEVGCVCKAVLCGSAVMHSCVCGWEGREFGECCVWGQLRGKWDSRCQNTWEDYQYHASWGACKKRIVGV